MNIDVVRLILIVLHIVVAAVAFSITMGGSSSIKRAKGAGDAALAHAVADYNRRGMIAGITGVLTLLTGLGLIFYMGGFKVVTANYHVAMAIVLGMIVLGFGFLKPNGERMQEVINGKRPANELDGLVARSSMGSGIMQLLWVTTLVFMFVRF